MKRRLPRLALAIILAAPPLACGGGGVHAQEQRWDGTITLTHTFTGTEDGNQVSWTREERWENLVANAESADEFYASLDATWRVTDSRTEVGDPCTYTYEASGEAEYPWFSFDVNPMDEVSYRLSSGGTGSGVNDEYAVTGIVTSACAGEPPTTMPYMVMASWLPPVPFAIPADLLPEGVEIPKTLSIFNSIPAISGTLDPDDPGVLRGSVTQRSDEGVVSTLTWDLLRFDMEV